MNIYILTIFPDFARAVFEYGIIRRAVESGLIKPRCIDIRDFTGDAHRSVDDTQFGGGPGMVMLPEPIWLAVEEITREEGEKPHFVYLTPQGEPLTRELVDELAGLPSLALLAGRYEGIDQRVREHLVDREVSIGDYVLTGGELAAMVVVDAVVRKLPGALGNEQSTKIESFEGGLLDFPHFTRPEEFKGYNVPEVLRGGDKGAVELWRRWQSLRTTRSRRPDLWREFCREYFENGEKKLD